MIDMVEMSRRITSHAVFGGVDEVDHFAGADSADAACSAD